MTKRVNITIPDYLYNDIQKLKSEHGVKVKVSKICQSALKDTVDAMKALLDERDNDKYKLNIVESTIKELIEKRENLVKKWADIKPL